MTDIQARANLEAIRQWAKAKLATEAEPPWSWYQHMKLIEAADIILKGMKSVTNVAHLTVAADNTDGIEVDLPI